MNKLYTIICISAIFNYISIAQELPTIMPSSPNAASLGQYGDFPVNYYTGVPNISIPLYTIKSGKIELPISLSYHASGINVAQEASWVGLGWSLNSGGVITRQVRGLDDFKNGLGYSYFGDHDLPPMNQNTYNPDYGDYFHLLDESLDVYGQIEAYHRGSWDAQPDVFNYNFFGYSGKLVIEKQGGTVIKATTIDQNNLDFQYDRNLEKWIVTDEKGWKFYFATTEVSRNAASSKVIPGYPESPWSEPVITSWFIDRVETPNNDFIDFVYGDGGRFTTPVTYVEQISHSFNNSQFSQDIEVNGGPGLVIPDADFGYSDSYQNTSNHQSTYNCFVSETSEVVLQRINFINGYLQFNTVSGHDRIPYDNDQRHVLNNISVKRLNGNEIKNIWFDTSYFRDDKLSSEDKGLFLRLRLDEVRENYPKSGGGYVSKPSYKFTYDESPLPAKNDLLSIDNWGYHNGAGNNNIYGYDFINFPSGYGNGIYIHRREPTVGQTSIPYYTYLGNSSNEYVKIFMNGADRNVNEDFIQAGILNSIEYPTGGVTKFQFEPNDYYKVGEYNNEYETYLVTSDGSINDEEFSISGNGAFVFLEFEFLHPLHGDPGYDGFINDMLAIFEKSDGSKIVQFEPEYSDVNNVDSNGTYEMRSYIAVFLEPGSYRIRVQEDPAHYYMSINLRAKVLKHTSTTKKMAGGLRIKSIKNFANKYEINPATTKTFKYHENDGKSTGRLLSPIQYFYNETDLIANRGNFGSTCCFIGSIVNPSYQGINKIYRSTSSFIPMASSTQGNIIGYNKVFISEKDSNGNNLGETEYRFKNYVDETRGTFFPGVPNYSFIENGQLSDEIQRNSQGNIVRERSIIYYQKESNRINGIVTKMPSARYNNLGGEPDEAGNYLFLMARFYDIDIEWWHPYQEVETIYDKNGQNPVTTMKSFKYENPTHKLRTETIVTNSEGETLSTKFYFPDDVTSSSFLKGPALSTQDYNNIKLLKSPDANNPTGQYRISEPVQSETTENGETIIQRTTYHGLDELVLPRIVSTLKGDFDSVENDLQDRLQFEGYDEAGNPIELHKVGGPSICYLWGYNSELPIAKIENASYSQIYSALGITEQELNDYDESDMPSIDGLREGLPHAMVTTFTYDPLIGVTSITDPRGYKLQYIYDEFNRLKEIRDADNNLVTDYQYNYKNQ